MKHLHKFRESSEANARQLKKSKLARIHEKTTQDVNDILDGIIPAKASKNLAMARQMARENAFEPMGAPLSF